MDNIDLQVCEDACPADPEKAQPGICGCGVPDDDTDSDATLDCNESCPLDPAKLLPGACGCGFVDDADSDLVFSCADDCNDLDVNVWNNPTEVQDLVLAHDGVSDTTTLSWAPPQDFGGTSVVYDVVRSLQPDDFVGVAECVESDDGSDTSATDSTPPTPGQVFFYLAIADNSCPDGQGLSGTDANGIPRSIRACDAVGGD